MGAIKVLVRTEGSSVAQLEKDLLPSLLLSHFSCVHSDHRVTCGHMVFSRQEYWSGLPYPQWGDLPNPEIQPMYHVSCIDRWVLYHWGHLGSPLTSLFCSVQLCSVTPSCPTLCDPMDCNLPGFPVHHQLPELAHVHPVGDAIQLSHLLSSPSPLAFNLSQDQVLFQWVRPWCLY